MSYEFRNLTHNSLLKNPIVLEHQPQGDLGAARRLLRSQSLHVRHILNAITATATDSEMPTDHVPIVERPPTAVKVAGAFCKSRHLPICRCWRPTRSDRLRNSRLRSCCIDADDAVVGFKSVSEMAE